MTLTAQIASNTLWQILGKGLGLVLSFLTLALITRHLGATGYGHFTTIIAFLQLFAILVDFGLQMTTVRLIATPDVDEKKMLGNLVSFRFVTAVIALSLAPLTALALSYPPEVKFGILLGTLIFLGQSLNSTLLGVFQERLRTGLFAAAEVFGKFIFFGLVWLAVIQNLSLQFILLAMIAGTLAQFFLTYLLANRLIPIRWQFDLVIWRRIWQLTWPLAISIILNLIYFRADTIILSLSRNLAEVGIYGAPYRVLEVLINLGYLFLGLLLPLMSASFAAGRLDEFKKLGQHGFDIICLATLPILAVFLVCGNALMALLTGPGYADAGPLMMILALAASAIFLAAVFGYLIVAADLQRQTIKFYFLNAVFGLTLYWFLIPIYSYWAAAWITVATEIFVLLANLWIIKRHCDWFPRLNFLAKATLASFVMALGLWFLAPFNLFVSLGVGAVLYAVTLWILRGLPASLQTLLTLKK